MRTLIRNLFTLFCLGLCPALSQEDEKPYGYVNIVNLIPGNSGCSIIIGGDDLVPGGLASGQDTGWFLLTAGAKSLKISQGELDEAMGELNVVDSEETLIAIFLQPNPKLGEDGKPLPPKIKTMQFPAFDGKGFALRVASTCPTVQRFEIGPKKIELESFKYVSIPGWGGGSFEIKNNGKVVGDVSEKNEPGAFYLFIGVGEKANFVTVIARADDRNGADPLGRKKKVVIQKDP